MLSRDMRYDPARKAPEKPMALQTMLFKYRVGDKKDNTYRCPHCEGKGSYPEEDDDELLVKCLECYGSGKMTFTYIRDYYFRQFQKYLQAHREWVSYTETVSRIRGKLTPAERAFLGMTDTIKGRRRKK